MGASDLAFSPVSESHGGKLSQVVLVVKNLFANAGDVRDLG